MWSRLTMTSMLLLFLMLTSWLQSGSPRETSKLQPSATIATAKGDSTEVAPTSATTEVASTVIAVQETTQKMSNPTAEPQGTTLQVNTQDSSTPSAAYVTSVAANDETTAVSTASPNQTPTGGVVSTVTSVQETTMKTPELSTTPTPTNSSSVITTQANTQSNATQASGGQNTMTTATPGKNGGVPSSTAASTTTKSGVDRTWKGLSNWLFTSALCFIGSYGVQLA
ncbi:hypothetical protein CRM22_007219 [Opisthorchis felineus]|uniref:Uncharacterized protein n=2 Tax=Opisthorchis felineus TaxID=147828 RepID=A0A4S2LHF9_OPIFE|nr:hypothetical protein CRM22_007219 [Opisthorchis felineus]TGZ62802.1 hypothetical protein CRM22_007219 [Opisthorchis felineus]